MFIYLYSCFMFSIINNIKIYLIVFYILSYIHLFFFVYIVDGLIKSPLSPLTKVLGKEDSDNDSINVKMVGYLKP